MATVPSRWFHAASSLGSTIYFTGGTTYDSTGKIVLLSDTIGLDVSQAWETSSPLLNTLAEVPATVSGHVMSKISGTTQLLIAGGESTSPLTQASFTYLFETKDGSWSVIATPTPPNRRLYSAAIATGKDGLLLEGGYLTTVANGTFDPSLVSLNPAAKFQPSSTTAVALAADAPALARHTMTLTTDGQAVILGGITPQGAVANLSIAHVLNTQNTGGWKAVPLAGTAPDPRMSFSTVMVNSTTMLVYGGTIDLKTGYSNAFYLDLPTWTWSSPPAQGDAPSLWGHTATMAGNFMVVGFGTSSTPRTENIALLDVTSNTWTKKFRPVGQYAPDETSKSKLSVGAVLGIAFVLTALIVGGAFHLLVRRRKRQTRNTLARQNMGDHTARSAVRSSALNEDRSLFRKLASLLGIGGSSSSRSRDNSRRSVRYSEMQLHSSAMAISSRMTQRGYSPVSLGYPENVVEHGCGQVSVSSYIYPNQACVETEKEVQDGQETQIVFHILTQAQQEALKLSKQPPSNKSKLHQLDY
ncbi:hypothetical protein KI688_010046 [Linnemannia hyalina]|uniref:Galactose oxidase n=1 Tax=Linnemannia hyalina TaxID=64524 RepID=A0A9P7Y0N2_9FUNG|nr:hypothetical protein KI688_010046 [Linnemannia hyalina]